MFAVIFRAKVAELGEEYNQTAERLRQLAIEKYGCTEFTSVAGTEEEIAISYWETDEQIKLWKNDAEHIASQELGKSNWYRWYKVQVAEIIREYESSE